MMELVYKQIFSEMALFWMLTVALAAKSDNGHDGGGEGPLEDK